jgi:flavin prenyltransferase
MHDSSTSQKMMPLDNSPAAKLSIDVRIPARMRLHSHRKTPKSIILGISGASGMIYATRTIKALLAMNETVDIVASKSAAMVWKAEHQVRMPLEPESQSAFWRDLAQESGGALRCHPFGDIGATIASGSFPTKGMLIVPCSMSTVAKIATGLSSNLLERAADVQIKEGRKLVVVPRETPLSLIHLKNLVTLAEAGATIVPAIPAWYHQPQSIEDLVDFVVARALDRLGIETKLIARWTGHSRKEIDTAFPAVMKYSSSN